VVHAVSLPGEKMPIVADAADGIERAETGAGVFEVREAVHGDRLAGLIDGGRGGARPARKLNRKEMLVVKYEYHPAAVMFPMMTEQERGELVDDIKEHGLLEPIILCDGTILDGRNRYECCRSAGVEPQFREIQCDDPVAYVMSHNYHRRQMTASQRGMVAARARKYYDAQAKEREAKTHFGANPAGPVTVPEPEKGDSRDQVGKLMHVGGSTVDKATKVLKSGNTELIRQVDEGCITVSVAAQKLAANPRRMPLQIATGMRYAKIAIVQLEKIGANDTQRQQALQYVQEWIGAQL